MTEAIEIASEEKYRTVKKVLDSVTLRRHDLDRVPEVGHQRNKKSRRPGHRPAFMFAAVALKPTTNYKPGVRDFRSGAERKALGEHVQGSRANHPLPLSLLLRGTVLRPDLNDGLE